jgi:hypothetical protein
MVSVLIFVFGAGVSLNLIRIQYLSEELEKLKGEING